MSLFDFIEQEHTLPMFSEQLSELSGAADFISHERLTRLGGGIPTYQGPTYQGGTRRHRRKDNGQIQASIRLSYASRPRKRNEPRGLPVPVGCKPNSGPMSFAMRLFNHCVFQPESSNEENHPACELEFPK